MLANESPAKRASAPDLVLTRVFDAPRSLVFEAWTKAEHVARWFTPAPLTTGECVVDFREGGAFRIAMRMPDGFEHVFDGHFGPIAPPELEPAVPLLLEVELNPGGV